MKEPTHEQHIILTSFLGKKRGITNSELTDDHWQLVRDGYLNNLVSLGSYPWIFKITQKGIDYLNKEKK